MEIVKKILVFTIVIFLFAVFIRGLFLDSPLVFECKDLQGNTIYCKTITKEYGGLYGTLEDGTIVQLQSYKRIERSE